MSKVEPLAVEPEPAARRPGWLDRIAHPGQFLAWSRYLVPPLAIATVLAFVAGLWLAFFASPPDYQMGDTVRIMYVHVPNAWLSQFTYAVMALASLGTLVWRHPLADVAAKSAAPLGAMFTALALYTGALWGRPTWGTYWEWDGRMTSTLLLLFIYLGIIALWRAFDDQLRAGRIAAVVTLVGALNIPVIKFSVDWWNTLHQPASVTRIAAPGMHVDMLYPLLVCALGFSLLFGAVVLAQTRAAVMERRVRALQMVRARRAEGSAA